MFVRVAAVGQVVEYPVDPVMVTIAAFGIRFQHPSVLDTVDKAVEAKSDAKSKCLISK